MFFFLIVLGLSSYIVINVWEFALNTPNFLEPYIIGIFTVLPILLVLTMFYGSKTYHRFLVYIYIPAVLWVGILVYLFMGALLLTPVILYAPNHIHSIASGLLLCIAGIISYGVWNARNIKTTIQEVVSPSLFTNWHDKKIILVSDLHTGIVWQEKFVKRLVEKINKENPDVVFIAGDIIDGPVFDYVKALSPLTNIKSTYGVYYTPGNHEYYNQEPEKFWPIIKGFTKTLIDTKEVVNNTQLIGIDYANEGADKILTRLTKSGFDSTLPSIAMLHDPRHAQVLGENGVSLILSGHTHQGQFFPISLLVWFLYRSYTYGITKIGNAVALTTSGVGTAMTPMRIGTRSEIVIVKILNK